MNDVKNAVDTDYIQGLLEAAVLCLTTVRGKFYPDKDFGAKIKYTLAEPEILSQARASLERLDGVYVKSVCKAENGIVVYNLTLNDDERQVELKYD